MTDPTHPLFGRRFAVVSIASTSGRSLGSVFVAYQNGMVLRIPQAATDLTPTHPQVTTKLTSQALTELKSVVEQCEVLCPVTREPSGGDSVPTNSDTSPTTSAPSFRR